MTQEEIEYLTASFNSGTEVTYTDRGNVLYIEDCECWIKNYITEKEECIDLEVASIDNFVLGK